MFRSPPPPITRERLERALAAVASIVAQPGGDVYVPIFERLEYELQLFNEKRSAVERARAMTYRTSAKVRGPRRRA